MQRPYRTVIVVGAVIALLGGAAALRLRQADRAPATGAAVSRAIVAAGPRPPAPAVRARKAVAARSSEETADARAAAKPLPPSLQGTEVDGWLGVDDDGHLVVTPGARQFFEYFLSATGEEAAEEIRARIIAEIERQLPEAAAKEAIALLDRYLGYRERLQKLAESGASEDLEQRLRQLQELRRQGFGDADAAALFGDEEAVQSVDIGRQNVLRNESLSAEERQRKLAELEQQLPEPVRAARAQALGPLRLAQEEAALRAQGAGPEEIRALRESQFGSEAAGRLEALDRERADWNRRVEDYRAARDRIEADRSLNAEQRARAIDDVKEQRFTLAERLRIDALDHTAHGPE